MGVRVWVCRLALLADGFWMGMNGNGWLRCPLKEGQSMKRNCWGVAANVLPSFKGHFVKHGWVRGRFSASE